MGTETNFDSLTDEEVADEIRELWNPIAGARIAEWYKNLVKSTAPTKADVDKDKLNRWSGHLEKLTSGLENGGTEVSDSQEWQNLRKAATVYTFYKLLDNELDDLEEETEKLRIGRQEKIIAESTDNTQRVLRIAAFQQSIYRDYEEQKVACDGSIEGATDDYLDASDNWFSAVGIKEYPEEIEPEMVIYFPVEPKPQVVNTIHTNFPSVQSRLQTEVQSMRRLKQESADDVIIKQLQTTIDSMERELEEINTFATFSNSIREAYGK